MTSQTTSFIFFTINTYAFLLGLGIILSIGISVITYRRNAPDAVVATIDTCLGGLTSGIIVGRVGHVCIHWTYFSEHISEALQIDAGGLNWHSAVIGAVLGAWLVKTIFHRQIDLHLLIESWTLAIPIIGLMGWWACETFWCGYGIEVDNLSNYPSLLVWEAPAMNGMIAPRFATQSLGMRWALIVVAVMLVCIWHGWLRRRRFGASLMLWAIGMLLLGYLRGDSVPMWAGLRIDQWLDALMLILGGGYVFWHR